MNTTQIQCYLAALGYYTLRDSVGCIAIDGNAGPATKSAIKEFQKDSKLSEDGIVGAKTEATIKEAIAEERYKEPQTPTSPTPPNTGGGSAQGKWKYFTYSEVKCRCGGRLCKQDTKMSDKLMAIADQIREHFGKPMEITSGIRCYDYNLEVYRQLGKPPVTNSAHIFGKAIDFRIPGVSASTILAYVRTIPGVAYSYAVDGNVVHINV